MKDEQSAIRLAELVEGDQPPRRVAASLRECRDLGLTRLEAIEILGRLRDRADDEAKEDRVLEMLDIVTGFCSAELNVWD